MMKRKTEKKSDEIIPGGIDEYINKMPEGARVRLREIRAAKSWTYMQRAHLHAGGMGTAECRRGLARKQHHRRRPECPPAPRMAGAHRVTSMRSRLHSADRLDFRAGTVDLAAVQFRSGVAISFRDRIQRGLHPVRGGFVVKVVAQDLQCIDLAIDL